MTQIPVNLQDEINTLAKNNPITHEGKLEYRLKSIAIMKNFYEDKAPDAPDGQARMFKSFAVALLYADNIIRRYHKLGIRLKELSEDEK